MNTKLNLCTASFVLAMASSLYADVLVDSFETTPVISGSAANPPYTAVGQSSAWSSDGANSLAVSFDTSGSWTWLYVAGDAAGDNYFPRQTYWDWYNYTTLQFDVHRPALGTGWNLDLGAGINGPQGWNQNGDMINWVWQNAGDSTTATVSWDYSAIRAAAPAPDLTGYTDWWQLALYARGSYGGTVYIDNIRFVNPVPEPSVVSLLLLAVPAALSFRAHRARRG